MQYNAIHGNLPKKHIDGVSNATNGIDEDDQNIDSDEDQEQEQEDDYQVDPIKGMESNYYNYGNQMESCFT